VQHNSFLPIAGSVFRHGTSGHISFSADEIDLETNVTRNIKLKVGHLALDGVPVPTIVAVFPARLRFSRRPRWLGAVRWGEVRWGAVGCGAVRCGAYSLHKMSVSIPT